MLDKIIDNLIRYLTIITLVVTLINQIKKNE